jgi:hypothetical protein
VAVRSGRTQLTDILLEGEHIDLDIQENRTGWSALHFAAERGDPDTTRALLRAGANAHLRDRNGLKPLEISEAKAAQERKWYKFWKKTGHERVRVSELLRKHCQKQPPVPPHRDERPPQETSPTSHLDTHPSPLKDKDGLTAQEEATASEGDTEGVCGLLTAASATPHSHPCEDTKTDQHEPPDQEQDSSTSQRASFTGRQDTPPTHQDIAPTPQTTTGSRQRGQSRMSLQTLRNLVNRTGQIARQIFSDLDQRLKSAEKKQYNISGVTRGESKGDVQKKQKTKDRRKGGSDNQTVSATTSLPVQ